MSEETMKCCECGKPFSLRDNGEGPVRGCPSCGTPLSEQIDRKFSRKELKLRDNRSLSEDHKTCPSCQKLSPNPSRICIHCGYDWETGKTNKTTFQKKVHLRSYLWALTLLILLAGVLGGFFILSSTRNAVPTPAEAPSGNPSIQDLQQQDFKKWSADFEAQSPQVQVGQQTKLELTTGRVRQVQIQSIRAQSVMVISEQGQEEIFFSTLRPQSRAQLDPAYRSQIILEARNRILSP